MLTLYHAPQSRSSRIIWLLEELGASYDIAYCDIRRKDGAGALDNRNPHPDKKVPTLVHDGALIMESSAIVLYLTDLFPSAGVGPVVGSPERGPYLSWLAYYAGVIEPVVTFQFVGLGDNADLQHTFRGRAEMDKRLLTALEKGPYIVGDHFSGVDILISSLGFWVRHLLPDHPSMDAYLKHCQSRPALQAAMAKDAAPA